MARSHRPARTTRTADAAPVPLAWRKPVALLAALALVATLTLAIMGRVSGLVFWLVAAACFGLTYLLKEK